MSEDKRGFKRIRTKVIVNGMKTNDQYRVPEHFLSFTTDLSCQGARIICAKDIKPNDQLVLTLEIPTSFIPVLTFSEAIWVKKVDGSCKDRKGNKTAVEAGVKFLKVEPWDSKKLKKFLETKDSQFCQNSLEAEPVQSPFHIHSPLKRLKEFFESESV